MDILGLLKNTAAHIKESAGEVPVLYANIPIRSMHMAKSS